MKSVRINPSELEGKISIPPSKSVSHRAVICAGLSQGVSKVENIIFSEDIIATCRAMESLGVRIENQYANDDRSTLIINGREDLDLYKDEIDCTESGSTLRFMIPIAALVGKKVGFKGKGKLVSRPLNDYYNIFDKQEINYTTVNGGLPLTIDGKLKAGEYELSGDVSSQFITGLLFALPLMDGDSKIIITTDLESKGYVDLTLEALEKFSVHVENNNYKEFIIKGNQKYISRDYKVEGDYSQAAFWITAGLLGGDLKCCDLDINSLQGDKEILDIVQRMKGNLTITDDCIQAVTSSTTGTIIDASQCPDIVPILAVLGSLSSGTTEIINAERLRIKESDRLKAISTELNKLGADIEEKQDGLLIKGVEKLKGGIVDSWNDHRIAMALAVASIKCTEPVTITNSDCVKKSYPGFWEDFKKMNGNLEVIE
ncbi:MAG: 3-phosphoshikimate 1-carboxyvinyltransferase [Bacillota bacterium]|nr:3-phosphoshikimate 1-carboxyvinyltransferase [Bacillota bacterium]